MRRLINILIVGAFLVCFMEWGNHQSAFIGQIEYDLLFKGRNLLDTLTHPLIIAGLLGQLALICAAAVPAPNQLIHLTAIVLLSAIVALILLAGVLSANPRMILSTLPFIGLCAFYFFRPTKQR